MAAVLTGPAPSANGAVAAQIAVLLVDDTLESRQALKRLVTNGRMSLVGEAMSGAEAVALAREAQPEAIVVSLEEPVARSLRTIEALSVAAPDVPVVVISSLTDKEYLRRAMLAGARDYLNQPLSPDELRKAVTTVVEAGQKRRSLTRDVLETGHRGDVIAVFSGKGGAGKTTLATNLAVAMALESKQKQRVALVDLDLFLGDVAIMLDVTPERTIADLVPVMDKLDPELLRSFLQVHSSGLKVLCAPTRVEEGELVTPDRVRRILDVLARTFDYVVLDLPRSLDDRVVTALDLASLVLLLTTYDVPCLKSTKVCLDMLRAWRYSEDKLKLVINHANRANGFGSSETEGALDYPIFWKLPTDPNLAQAANQGKPFVQVQPTAKAAQNLADLAATLAGVKR